jgi:hypothetical protein
LFLPDRYFSLQVVYQLMARGKRLRSVDGTHRHDDGQVTDHEVSDAVLDSYLYHIV